MTSGFNTIHERDGERHPATQPNTARQQEPPALGCSRAAKTGKLLIQFYLNIKMWNVRCSRQERSQHLTLRGLKPMASAQREPIAGVWERSPQRGPGAEPLVRESGGKAP